MQRAIKCLTCGARCAIKMHSKTNNVEHLRKDWPNHVFNNHLQCSPSFCKVAAAVTETNEVVLFSADENDALLGTIDR